MWAVIVILAIILCANFGIVAPRKDTCSAFDFSAVDCRKNSYCSYNCLDLTCQDTTDACSEKCQMLCHDQCKCLQEGCQYNHRDGSCRQGVKKCQATNFFNSKCLQGNSFYVIDGDICYNPNENDPCKRDTIYAINYGGNAMTGMDGIKYFSDGKSGLQVEHHQYYRRESKTVLGVPKMEENLYKTYAALFENDIQKCVGLFTKLPKKPGTYEMTLKLAEFEETKPGERFMSIRFNKGLQLIPAFDILAYVPPSHGLNLVIRFKLFLENDKIFVHVKGYEPTRVVTVAFMQVCKPNITCSNNNINETPVLSAISIVKLH